MTTDEIATIRKMLPPETTPNGIVNLFMTIMLAYAFTEEDKAMLCLILSECRFDTPGIITIIPQQ